MNFQISRHLPDEYKVLVKLVDILPNAEGSPVRPFLSLVVNINVCTVAHRDAKDFELCLVLAVGEFTGGGLVMREQGLVAAQEWGLCYIQVRRNYAFQFGLFG